MKKLKNFEIKENENVIYEIEISKLADNIIINVKAKDTNNSFKKFEKELTLEEIKETKYFLMYDSIDECIDEILSQMEIKEPSIKFENNNLKLIFYLSNKKFPFISFDLKETFKTYKDLIKENEELKKEIEKQKIKLKDNEEYINNLKSTIKSFGEDKEINIFIRYKNEYGTFVEKPYSFKMKDTIDYLIGTVKEKENMIEISSVHFEKNNLTYEIDNNLAYYGIYENSLIIFRVNYLGGEYIIKCEYPQFIKKFEFEEDNTIEEVKQKIFESDEFFSLAFGYFSPNLLILDYHGKILKDNK